MKIDFLTRWLPPRIDGVGDYTWNLACALREYGIEVRIFTSKGQRISKGELKNEWVFPIIKQWQPRPIIEALKAVTTAAPDWFCLQFVPQLYGCCGLTWQVPSILRVLKKEFRSNISVTFHEFISTWGIWPKDIFLAGASRMQTTRILSAVDLVLTTCKRYKSILQRLSVRPLPIIDIPVGANIEPVLITPEELASRRRRIFPDNARVLGLFSRLSPYRNFPFAVKALQRARRQGLDAWLYLIGSVEESNPELFRELMHFAEELKVAGYIITSGELTKEELSIQLKMVDVFVFPQIDGISTRNTALMAAMAHGLPIVSFKPCAGNFYDYCIPHGVLTEIGDEEGFIQAAVESIKNSNNVSGAASLNRDYYYKNFSWPVIAKRYLEALEA